MKITLRATECARQLLGMKYSKTYRYKWYKKGSTDCSGYAYAAYLAAGFPLLVNGEEKMTSMYEVYADGFSLLWPKDKNAIGKAYMPERAVDLRTGDLIFYHLSATARANRITHIALVYDAEHIIHTATTKEKACIKDISYRNDKIVAVLRIDEGSKEMERKRIDKGERGIYARRLQLLLNLNGEELNCDGIFGSATETALKMFQRNKGIPADGKCDLRTWEVLIKSVFGEISSAASGPSSHQWEDSDRGDLTEDRKGGSEEGDGMENIFRNLKSGCTGRDVMIVQQCCGAGADGNFGAKTKSALKAYQKAKGLAVDGVFGPASAAKMGIRYKSAEILNIGTWNIKRGKSSKSVCKKIAEGSAECHICGFQEVTAGLAAVIAGDHDYRMVRTVGDYGHMAAFGGGLKLKSTEEFPLPAGGEARKLLRLILDCNGRTVHFYATHIQFTSSARPDINEKQMRYVLDRMKKDGGAVQILTGDFNCDISLIDKVFSAEGYIAANRLLKVPALITGGTAAAYGMDNIILKGVKRVTDRWMYPSIKKGISDHDGFFCQIEI